MLTVLLSLLACDGALPTDTGNPTGDPTVDADGDGFVETEDCDDADADVNPDAEERCNDIDDDCDGAVDVNPVDGDSFYADVDGDGFGAGAAVVECAAPADHVTNDADCDDVDAAVNPDADELCDAVDRDCDNDAEAGAVDAATWFADEDADGFGDAFETQDACSQPAGYVADDTDCDDEDDTVRPDSIWYVDSDFDGFGEAGTTVMDCYAPSGYAAVDGDCDDTRSQVNPGAAELCDSLDNDCDGIPDGPACAGFAGTWTGDFQLGAVEQVGTFVVNNMQCTGGTATLTIDLAADPVVQGTSSCTYSGGLGGYAGSQSGTFEGDLALDGTIEGTYFHEYGSFPDDSYSFDADLGAGTLVGSGGYYPSSFSAVAWDVDFSSTVLVQQ